MLMLQYAKVKVEITSLSAICQCDSCGKYNAYMPLSIYNHVLSMETLYVAPCSILALASTKNDQCKRCSWYETYRMVAQIISFWYGVHVSSVIISNCILQNQKILCCT